MRVEERTPMEVESTGAEALPEHAETQRPPRRPSPISLARQPSAQWDSKEEGASGADAGRAGR